MKTSNAVFNALADPTRREIIALLKRGPKTSGEIAAHFSSAWPTISRHLSVLKDADIIVAERNGNRISYELNATVLQDLVAHIFNWTRRDGKDA